MSRDVLTELERANRFQEAVLETVPMGILLLDKQNNLIYHNRRIQSFFGFKQKKQAGRFLAEIKKLGTTNGVRGRFPILEQVKELTKGQKTYLEIFYPIHNKQKRLEYVLGLFEDITERKTLQIALFQAQKIASLGEILGGIAHELNNPITSIQTHLLLLNQQAQKEQFSSEHFEVIERNTTRITNVLSNLTRTYQVKPGPGKEVGSLHKFLKTLFEQFRNNIEAENIKVILVFHGPDLRLKVEERKIEQLFLHLLLNSKKALRKKIKKKQITARVDTRDRDRVYIEVKDTGCGIAKKYLSKIFDPFFTTEEAGQGTGLGLYVVKGLLHQWNGKIKLKSRVGQGTSVLISLKKDSLKEPVVGGGG